MRTLNKIVFLFCILNYGHLIASSINFSGIISSNQTWVVDTVNVNGNITINNGATLTIASGCKVIMSGFYRWEVNGAIQAYGSSSAPIHFTSNDTLNFWNTQLGNGGWKGMFFQYVDVANDSTIFDNCIFSYVKRGNDSNYPTACIQMFFFDKLRVSNCTFTNNYNILACPGIWMSYCSPKIINSTFHGNSGDIGGCIAINGESSPLIDKNLFYNNYAVRNGGAISVQGGTPIITNNGFFNNHIELANCGPSDGGGAIRLTNGSIGYLANNVIANNEAGSKGGGLECLYGSHAIIENNTIVHNNGYLGGGGLYLFQSSPILRNNIFWGNTRFTANFSNQIMFFTDDSEPVIQNCVFEGGPAEFMYATNVTYSGSVASVYTFDPQFISTSGGSGIGYNGNNADWRLQQTSPCIDMGVNQTEVDIPQVDYWGGIRFSGSAIDIGAYEFFKGEFTDLKEITDNNFLVYPNPSTGMVFIVTYQPSVPFEIFSFDGKHILTTAEKQFHLDSGIYIISCGSVSKKLVIE